MGQFDWVQDGFSRPADDPVGYRPIGVADVEPLPFSLDELLRVLAVRNGSDLHLSAGLPPMGRVDGDLIPLADLRMDGMQCRALTYEALSDEQIAKYEQTHELDCSYSVKNVGRFRMNVYRQRDTVGAAFRAIPNKVPSLEDLRLPHTIADICRRTNGLVLVTGPTGSGKSTTLAALVDLINANRACHVMTLEDPIEYLHDHKRSMVNQRELGTDTDSFANALRAVL
ncbi:MAG: Flp pilus assembly complex ATPase component TadA, partial [Chloroflexi bacterium]|nr:Flp pilus assembly complex ATPase component TadA [Chloroflexota bacterium]